MVTPLIVMTDPLPSTLFPYVVGKALWTRTLIEIAFGLWVMLLLRDSSYRLPKSWTLAVLGVYVLIALLATVFSVSITRSLWSTYERMQGWVDLAHWATFVVILVSTHRTWAHWRALLNFNLGVGYLDRTARPHAVLRHPGVRIPPIQEPAGYYPGQPDLCGRVHAGELLYRFGVPSGVAPR